MNQQSFLSREHQWARWRRASTGLFFAASVSFVAILGNRYTNNIESLKVINRIFVLLGGRFMAGGHIQFFTFFAFFWALLESLHFKKEFEIEQLKPLLKLISNSHKALTGPEMVTLENQVVSFEKNHGKNLFSDLLKKAVWQFKSSPSTSEVMELVNVQIEIYKEKAFSSQNIIRYLNFAIPSLGFIGTVLGLSDAMMIAHTGDMERISISLGVAFDTTLVALVLGLILMWHIHELEELTDLYHAETKEFFFSHLVPRLGHRNGPET